MIRSRTALAISVSLAAVHCTTNPASFGDLAPPAPRTGALTVPLASGNGPHAMVVCRSDTGTNDCFPGGDITNAAGLNAALVPPDAWFAAASFPIGFPYVHSWELGREINFWSYTGTFPDNAGAFAATTGGMDLDDRSLFPGANPTTGAQFHFTRLFAGFIALPAGSTTRTFAVAADDGYSFALGGTTAGLVTKSDFGNHSIVDAYRTPANVFDATFSDTVQLYPFALATYQNGAASPISGVEFAWAPGAKADNPGPTFNVPNGSRQWDPKTYSLVPGAQIYSPDVRATMTWSGGSTAGSTVTFRALVRNVGQVAAFPAGTPPDVAPRSCDGPGLCYTLALPRAQFDRASITVDGIISTAIPNNVIDNGTNLLVSFAFGGSGSSSLLLPNDFAVITVSAKLAAGIAAGTRIYAQGRITGHATDPAVFGASSFAPPYSLAVLTNDVTPVADNAFLDDGGNRPSAFVGFTNEGNASAASRVTVVSAALGGDDDDATLIVAGSAAPGAPSFTAGTLALETGLHTVDITGTSVSLPVRVVLANTKTPFTQATCPATATWRWDSLNGECACRPTSTTAWVCDPVALPDCAPAGNVCYEASVSVADATGDFPPLALTANQPFTVLPATTSLASKASAATFHSVTLSGVVDLNGAAGTATGATVNAALAKAGAAGTCTTIVKADQSWTCDAPVACAAPATSPCVVDGAFDATASLVEATGAKPIAGQNAFTLDSQPGIAALATTNTQRPTFSGTLKAPIAPRSILVCDARATACAANGAGFNRPLCGNTGDTVVATAGAWSCRPGPAASIATGTYSLVAFEADANGNVSAATLPQPLLVNATRPSLDVFPTNLLFNIVTPTLVGGATCAPGEQVGASFPGSATLATATCSTTCVGTGTNGSWSCPLAIPVVDRTAGLSISVSQTADDATISGPSARAGFVVDTLAPRPPSFTGPAGAATRNPSPALQISTTEAGGSVAVSVVDGAGQTVAACPAQAVPATGAVTCTPSPALADGTYTLQARQTDLAQNPSSPGTSTLRVKTRTATPLFSALAGLTIANPVQIEGSAEPGASVSVKLDDATALPAVTADATGHFSVPAGVIATGSHFAQATATDSLGNTAPSSRAQFSVSLAGHVAGSSFGCSSAGGSGSYAALLLLGIVPLLGRRRKGMVLAAVVAASAGAARADGTDLGLDSFRPASGGDGTIGVEGARPLADGEASWEARGLLVGQSKPLVFVPDGGGQSQALIRSRVGGWLTGQAHVAGPLSLGLQLPFLVQQSGDLAPLPSNVSGGAILGGGLGDLRATARLGILRQERAGFDFAFQASADLPTAKKQSFLGDSAVQGEGLAAVGYRVAFSARSALDLLGNAFFRLRPSRDVLGVKTGSEIGLRAAVAWLPGGGPLAPQRAVFEVEGASFLRSGLDSGSVPSEWRGGISYCAGPVTFDFGIGGGLAAGVGTPGLRVIGGVGYSPSVCNPNTRPAPARPVSPVRLVDADPPAATQKPSAPARTEEKPAAVAAVTPLPAQKARGNDVTMLPLPELPPLPPAKAPKKRTVAQADALPAMPDLPSVMALPLPIASPGAALSGDRLELARPVAFRGSRLPAKEAMLDDVARVLSAHPEIELVAISAPDDGRAKAVVAYLRKRGVAASRLRPEGRSETVEVRVLRRR